MSLRVSPLAARKVETISLRCRPLAGLVSAAPGVHYTEPPKQEAFVTQRCFRPSDTQVDGVHWDDFSKYISKVPLEVEGLTTCAPISSSPCPPLLKRSGLLLKSLPVRTRPRVEQVLATRPWQGPSSKGAAKGGGNHQAGSRLRGRRPVTSFCGSTCSSQDLRKGQLVMYLQGLPPDKELRSSRAFLETD